MIYSLQIYMNSYKLEDTLVIDDIMKWGRIESDEIKFFQRKSMIPERSVRERRKLKWNAAVNK